MRSESSARRDLAACHVLLARHGMSDLFVTHVSLRIDGEDAYLLSPFGVLFEDVTPESLVKVPLYSDASASQNETAVRIHGPLQRAGNAAVVHTHTVAGNAVACHPDGLLPVTQKAMLVLPFVRTHEYNALALDDDEGEAMQASLGSEARVLILRNHGLLTTGSNMGEAFLWMEWMERACQYQVALPANPVVPSNDAIEQTFEQSRRVLGRGGPLDFALPVYWEGLMRSLARRP